MSISDQPQTKKPMLKPTMGRQLSTVGEEQWEAHVGGSMPSGTAAHEMLRILDERWEAEVIRLAEFLERNMNLVQNLGGHGTGSATHVGRINDVQQRLDRARDPPDRHPSMITA